MSLENLYNLITGAGFPCAYNHFRAEQRPSLPYTTIKQTTTNNIFCDNKTYKNINHYELELVTKTKDQEAEARIINLLNSAGIAWQKTAEDYDDTDAVFYIFYEFEF